MARLRRAGLFVFCAAFLAGCGGDGKVNARGQVLKGGAPFRVPQEEFVKVVFYPIFPDGKPPNNQYIARYDNGTGKFTVVGGDGHGLPPGKYHVSVEHERKKKDLFKGAYDAERSPFVFDIDSGTPDLVIDLDKAPAPPARQSAWR